MKTFKVPICRLALLLAAIFFTTTAASAQTTTFTYQGRLSDGSTTANGTYDLGFALFDAETGGTQIGTAQTRAAVTVTNGVFTVQLDFGAAAFPGANRFLEIAVKRQSDANFTTLAPRQQITSTLYAIRAVSAATADTAANATQLGGTAANQFVQTADARLTDSRAPTAGSNNYIQNQNAAAQASANFNIDGTGTANIFNARTQFNIGGSRAFAAVGDNTFAGTEAGRDTSGVGNSIFGYFAGRVNSSGNNNSFFGRSAGIANTSGGFNSFFGQFAGESNTTGTGNSFFGRSSGNFNHTGSFNTMLGERANVSETNLMFATALGSGAVVGTSDTIVLGKIAGTYAGNSRPADAVQIPGALSVAGNITTGGTLSGNTVNSAAQYNIVGRGKLRIDSMSNILVGNMRPAYDNQNNEQIVGGSNNSYFGVNTGSAFNNDDLGFNTIGSNNTLIGANTSIGSHDLNYATAIGAGAGVNSSNTIVLGRSTQGLDTVIAAGNVNIGGVLQVSLLGAGPGGTLCRNNSTGQLSSCSSSMRYKTNVAPFASGLSLINNLRPVTFDWKADGTHDVGFIAEEVNAVEPLLSIYNDKGQIEGVKYDRFSVLFVNAFKEQQAQIEQQQKQINELKQIVCALKPEAAVCKNREEK